MDVYDLVFEGGGAKGVVFVGAYEVLDRMFKERNETYGRLLGTSAGAIIATFLAAGYTPAEMLTALTEKTEAGRSIFSIFLDPPQFEENIIETSQLAKLLRDINIPVLPDFVEDPLDIRLAKLVLAKLPQLFSLLEQGGLFSADGFMEWLDRKLNEGEFQGQPRNFCEMTLKEFYEVTGNRDLSLVAADITGQRMLVLNHRTAPDVPVVMAVRMSMNIPMVWPAVVWQSEWGSYHGLRGKRDLTGHSIVDGSLLSRFPIELFLSKDPQVTAVMGQPSTHRVLGFLIDEQLPVENAPPQCTNNSSGFVQQLVALNHHLEHIAALEHISQVINTALFARSKMAVEAYSEAVVRLPAQGYSGLNFDMDDRCREALIEAGRKAMQQFLNIQADISPGFEVDNTSSSEQDTQTDQVAEEILE